MSWGQVFAVRRSAVHSLVIFLLETRGELIAEISGKRKMGSVTRSCTSPRSVWKIGKTAFSYGEINGIVLNLIVYFISRHHRMEPKPNFEAEGADRGL
jgi:hypothetical protein